MTTLASQTIEGRGAPASFVIGLNLCLVGIYTNYAVQIGASWVPGVPVVLGVLFLFPHLRNSKWLWWLLLFLAVSLFAGGSGLAYFRVRFDSWLQLSVAIGCAHIILCAMKFPKTVRKNLAIWLVFIVVGVTAEKLFPPFRYLSDSFREVIFEGRWIYDSVERDIRDYGFVRPKLFTQEPSHVAKSFVVFGTGWYVLSSFRNRLAVLLVSTAVVTFFLGSPIALLVVPLALFLSRIASGRPVSGIVATLIPVLGLVTVILAQAFSARFSRVLSGTDVSFFSRYQGPYEVAIRTLGDHPIFGVGIGAKEYLWNDIYSTYSKVFSYDPSWLYHHFGQILSNAFANSLSFFGIAGALVFYSLITQWMKESDIPVKASLPVIVLFLQLDGSLEGLRMWGSLAVILGCFAMALRSGAETASGTSLDRHDSGGAIGPSAAESPGASLVRHGEMLNAAGPVRWKYRGHPEAVG